MGSKGRGGGQRGSEGPGRVIWVLKVVGGSEGFRRSWQGDVGSGGPPPTLGAVGDGSVLLMGVSGRGAPPGAGRGAVLQDAAAVPTAAPRVTGAPVQAAAPADQYGPV